MVNNDHLPFQETISRPNCLKRFQKEFGDKTSDSSEGMKNSELICKLLNCKNIGDFCDVKVM